MSNQFIFVQQCEKLEINSSGVHTSSQGQVQEGPSTVISHARGGQDWRGPYSTTQVQLDPMSWGGGGVPVWLSPIHHGLTE